MSRLGGPTHRLDHRFQVYGDVLLPATLHLLEIGLQGRVGDIRIQFEAWKVLVEGLD